MFDWPERIHTSPTRTFAHACTSRPSAETTRRRGSFDAAIGASVTAHLPSAATASHRCPANATATRVPLFAQPQTLTALSRCSTMLSAKTRAKRVPAGAAANDVPTIAADSKAASTVFIMSICVSLSRTVQMTCGPHPRSHVAMRSQQRTRVSSPAAECATRSASNASAPAGATRMTVEPPNLKYPFSSPFACWSPV